MHGTRSHCFSEVRTRNNLTNRYSHVGPKFSRLVSLKGDTTNSLTRSSRKSHECAVGAAGFRRKGGA